MEDVTLLLQGSEVAIKSWMKTKKQTKTKIIIDIIPIQSSRHPSFHFCEFCAFERSRYTR